MVLPKLGKSDLIHERISVSRVRNIAKIPAVSESFDFLEE